MAEVFEVRTTVLKHFFYLTDFDLFLGRQSTMSLGFDLSLNFC
jgi:hypothetical protein